MTTHYCFRVILPSLFLYAPAAFMLLLLSLCGFSFGEVMFQLGSALRAVPVAQLRSAGSNLNQAYLLVAMTAMFVLAVCRRHHGPIDRALDAHMQAWEESGGHVNDLMQPKGPRS